MVKVSVGLMGSSVAGGSAALSTPQQVQEFLDCCKSHGVKELDTARVYASGKSEELLGAVSAGSTFAVSTKAPAFAPNSLAYDKIIANCNASVTALQQDKFDIYYIHGPDRETPLEEQCRAMGQLYREGKFERFGVSNISPEEVQTMYDICSREGYVLPSVYQGAMNPIHRAAETGLMPLLKKLNMDYYVFSPLAGGLFAKPLSAIQNPEKGTRFDMMKVFGDLYLSDVNIESFQRLAKTCEKENVSLVEATMRWWMHHSPLGEQDAVILGASSTKQLEASLSACEEGPLPKTLQQEFEDMWERTKDDAPRYHS